MNSSYVFQSDLLKIFDSFVVFIFGSSKYFSGSLVQYSTRNLYMKWEGSYILHFYSGLIIKLFPIYYILRAVIFTLYEIFIRLVVYYWLLHRFSWNRFLFFDTLYCTETRNTKKYWDFLFHPVFPMPDEMDLWFYGPGVQQCFFLHFFLSPNSNLKVLFILFRWFLFFCFSWKRRILLNWMDTPNFRSRGL